MAEKGQECASMLIAKAHWRGAGIIDTSPTSLCKDEEPGYAVRWRDAPLNLHNLVAIDQHAVVDQAEAVKRATDFVRSRQQAKPTHPGLLWLFEPYTSAQIPAPHLADWTHVLTGAGMIADIAQLKAPAEQSGVTIKRATTETGLRDYLAVNLEATRFDEPGLTDLLLLPMWREHAYTYVVYLNGKAVSCASAVPRSDTLYLSWVATLTSEQRKGYAEMACRAALTSARNGTGLTKTQLHGSLAGQGLYKKLGYTFDATLHMYALAP